MTEREQVAFFAGIRHAASLVQVAAVTIEIRDDASHACQQAAAAALHGLAEGLKQAVGNVSKSGSTPTPNGHAELSGIHSPRGTASRATTIAQGFTGDTCDACGSAEMKRSGTDVPVLWLDDGVRIVDETCFHPDLYRTRACRMMR